MFVLYDGKNTMATGSFDKSRASAMLRQVSGQAAPVSESTQESKGQLTATFNKVTDIYGRTIGFLGTETLSATGMQIRADLLRKMEIVGGVLLVTVLLLGFFI